MRTVGSCPRCKGGALVLGSVDDGVTAACDGQMIIRRRATLECDHACGWRRIGRVDGAFFDHDIGEFVGGRFVEEDP